MNSASTAVDPQRRKLLQLAGTGLALGGLAPRAGAAFASTSALSDVVDVAIIGAGLAGLTAARDLQRAGLASFVVLEARDRVGGRTYDHDLGGGMISEAGGQWIGPGQTAIANLARELNVETFNSHYRGKTVFLGTDARVAQDLGTGGVSIDHGVVDKLNEMACRVPSDTPWEAPDGEELDRLSVGDWLAQQGVSIEDRLSFDISNTLTFGTTPANLSLLHYLSFIRSSDCNLEKLESMKGGAQESRFIGGPQQLSVRMAQQLGDRVRRSSPVRRIVGWDRAVVALHTDRGVIRARQVIAALNPGLCDQIAFDPPLPEGRAQMQRHFPAHAPMRKTVHVYPRPFWRDRGLNGQIVPIAGPLIWSYDNSPPDASVGVLNAFVRAGQLPADHQRAEQRITELYVRALGEQARNPIQFHDHDWGKVDPWSLTCMFPAQPGFLTQWGRYLHPPTGRLIWSGTETAAIWAGSMDGAVRSGHRAALRALQALARA